MIEKAIYVVNISDLKLATSKYERVYFGNEFCERLIPSHSQLIEIVQYCEQNNLDFSLVTPYVTDKGLRDLEKLFAWLNKNKKKCEIIVNDYGVLNLLNEKYQNLSPVLGRLLTKQKRDPRIEKLLKKKPKKRIFINKKKEYLIFLPRKVPSSLVAYYRGANVNIHNFQKFLADQRITRVEIDNLLQGINLRIPKDKLSVSLYVPYGYITTSRLCSANPFRKKRKFFCEISYCKRECQKYTSELRNQNMPFILYKRGNTLFYQNKKISSNRWLAGKGIDRLIYQPKIPI